MTYRINDLFMINGAAEEFHSRFSLASRKKINLSAWRQSSVHLGIIRLNVP